VIIPPSRLTWVDREGRPIGRIEQPRRFERFPALSPDGARAAVAELADDRWDTGTSELGSGTSTRLTSDGFARSPVWMPDGRSVIYNTMQPGAQPTLKRVAADGSGFIEEIGTGRDATLARDGHVMPTGETASFLSPVWCRVEGAFVTGPDWENGPRLSTDGRFVAYLSADAATFRGALHVKPFPARDDNWHVARDGSNARWSADGRRLFFADDTGVHEAEVLTHPQFRVGIPRRLFPLQPIASTGVRSVSMSLATVSAFCSSSPTDHRRCKVPWSY
jgi:hypothetical protein